MDIWRRLLPAPPDSVTDDFFALGGHSLIAIELVAECERRFGVRLPLATLLERSSIEALAEVIDGRSATTFSPLVALKPDGSRRPFFCVHGIGGEALFLKPLAAQLHAEQPFYALQADPALRTLPPGELIPAMAARYLDAIRTVQPSGPYAIGGYSFGGTVALEMARQLKAKNEDVSLLVMFDHSPHHTPGRHEASWPRRIAGIVRNLPLWIADDLLRTPLRRMSIRMRGRVLELFQRAGRMGHPSVEAYFGVSEIPDQTRGCFTAHHHATRVYRPRPYDGDVTLFRGRCEPLLRPRTYDLGWSHLTRGCVCVHRLPGSHANLLREPFVDEVARLLCRCLADAQAPAADPR
jgi:thioesterase domain-containing protein/acyl carrier protein